MELRQQIEALIIKGKTKEALNLLKNQEGLPKSFHDEITLLQADFQKNEKERGTLISYENADIQQNRINLKTLNLTSDFVAYKNAPKRSFKNLFRKRVERTPETNDFADEADNIRQKLLERYEHRLQQKTDNRLPVDLELTYTKEGTSPAYLHLDECRVSEKLQGDLVDTLKKHRHLLIVGKPGAGKTTQLLELAKAWLSDDANEQIPVIFNLSAWKADDQYLHDWLQAALVSGYGFSPSLAKEAMDKQQIIPLLDGLDEVGKDKADDTEQTDLRNQCLQAISQYLRLYNTPYLVIASRIKEFAAAGDAPVKAEILVNPLTPQAIKHTLKTALTKTQQVNNETAATTLLDLLPKHPVLEDILCTPFYYNIALDVFDDRTTRHDLPQEQAALELYLIEQFIDKKLDTTDNPRHFTDERTRGSLAWVADVLERESWVSFELVDFQPWHLRHKWLMNLFGGLVFGLVLSLVLGMVFSLLAEFNFALSLSLAIATVVTLAIGLAGNLVFRLIFGLVAGFAVGFLIGLIFGSLASYGFDVDLDNWIFGFAVSLIASLSASLVFGLIINMENRPMRLLLILVASLCFGSTFGTIVGLIGSFAAGLIVGLIRYSSANLILNLSIKPKEIKKIRLSNLLKLTTWRQIIHQTLISGSVAIFIGGFAGLFVVGLTNFFAVDVFLDVDEDIRIVFFSVAVFGLIIGFIFGFVWGIIQGLFKGIFVISTFSNVKSPYYRLSSDLTFKIVQTTLTIIFSLSTIYFFVEYMGFWTATDVNLIEIFIIILTIPIISILVTSFFYHFILRLALYLEKKMPLRWVSFFKYATSARILEQDGGQWRFRHQILQDYFAERYGKDVEKDSK